MPTRASTRDPCSAHNLLPDTQWAAISGWPLVALGSLAERTGRHSLLTFACRSRARWRQSFFMAIALGALDDPARFLRKSGQTRAGAVANAGLVADVLPVLSPTQILDACFDTRPAGLLRVLGKVGFGILDEDTYALLGSWYASAKSAEAYRSTLQAMTEIDQARMDVLSALNPILVQPALLWFIKTTAAAHDLNAALGLIRAVCSSATPEALRASVRDIQGGSTISAWCESWLRRADRFPPPPFLGDDECFPLTTAHQIIEAGRRFKNCLGTRYLAPAIGGNLAIVEFGPGLAIALLLRLHDEHWFFLGCHAPRNKPIAADLAAQVEKKVLSLSPMIHARASSNRAQSLMLQKYLIDDSLADLDLLPFEY